MIVTTFRFILKYWIFFLSCHSGVYKVSKIREHHKIEFFWDKWIPSSKFGHANYFPIFPSFHLYNKSWYNDNRFRPPPKKKKKKNMRRLYFGCYYYRSFPVHSSGLVPRPLALHAEGPGSILTTVHQCNIIFMSIFYIKYIVTPMIFFFYNRLDFLTLRCTSLILTYR